jgi:hypothetical protein
MPTAYRPVGVNYCNKKDFSIFVLTPDFTHAMSMPQLGWAICLETT